MSRLPELPEFFGEADKQALSWERRYLLSEAIQLGVLLVPVMAAVAIHPVPLWVSLVALLAAMVMHLYRRAAKADEKWWNGRAAAESAKTLGWRYLVGGSPFQIDGDGSDVKLAQRLSDIATHLANRLPVSVSGDVVTDSMRDKRALSLNARVELYRDQRIEQQQRWYSSKSKLNETRGRLWFAVSIGAQGTAVLIGIVVSAVGWKIDPVPFFAAAASSAVAWSAVKQFEVLARSYAVASNELAVISTQIRARQWDEDSWAAFVDGAEEAISREHTSWRASRAV